MPKFLRYVIYLSSVLLLAGCILKPGKGMNKGRKFRSPVEASPAVSNSYSAQQIREILQRRTGQINTVRANFELTAGGGLRGKQIFNAMMFIDIPGFLRVRGLQNEGTLFDLLINRQSVQLLSHPDRKYYRGTMEQLQQNPDLLAGIQPQDLMEQFAIEQTLISRLETLQYPAEFEKSYYKLRFQRPNGTTEVYRLRASDLLCDLFERYYGEQLMSSIHYWAYDYYGGFLLPTEFVIQLPDNKGEFAVRVTSAQVNPPVPPELQSLQVPEGFERMALGRY